MHLTSAQLTLLAAGVAAVASLAGIAINVRSTSRIELRKWRRNEERALIANILSNLHEVRELWSFIAVRADAERARELEPSAEREVREARLNVNQAERELRLAVAEVELIAGSKVVECAKALETPLENVRHLLRATSGADGRMNAYGDVIGGFDVVRTELVDAVRKELRIDRAPRLRRQLQNVGIGLRTWLSLRRYRFTAWWRARQGSR